MKTALAALTATLSVFAAASIDFAYSQSSAPPPKAESPTGSVSEPAETRVIRTQYEGMEKRSRELAAELRRQAESQPSDEAALNRKREELRAAIAASFRLRQGLLRSELTEFQRRMTAIDRLIQERDRAQAQIIDRRFDELTDSKLNWEPSLLTSKESGVGPEPGLQPAPAIVANRPVASNSIPEKKGPRNELEALAELQGVWELVPKAGAAPLPNDPKRALVFWGDRCAMSQDDKIIAAFFIQIDLQVIPRRLRLVALDQQSKRFETPVLCDLQGERLIWEPFRRTIAAPTDPEPSDHQEYKRTSPTASSPMIDAILRADAESNPHMKVSNALQRSLANLKTLMKAMRDYAAASPEKRFPPAVLYGKDGKGKFPHSWRVALLPYLGRKDLYDKYRFDEPWDSRNNFRIVDEMPDVFRSPLDEPDSLVTSYFCLVTPDLAGKVQGDDANDGLKWNQGTIFSNPKGTRLDDIKDGPSNTIALVEAKQEVVWANPADIMFYLATPHLNWVKSWHAEGHPVGFADGVTKILAKDLPIARGLFTIGGGEKEPPFAIQGAIYGDWKIADQNGTPLTETKVSIFRAIYREGSDQPDVEGVSSPLAGNQRIGYNGQLLLSFKTIWNDDPRSCYYVYFSSPRLPARSLKIGAGGIPRFLTIFFDQKSAGNLEAPAGYTATATLDGVMLTRKGGLGGSAPTK